MLSINLFINRNVDISDPASLEAGMIELQTLHRDVAQSLADLQGILVNLKIRRQAMQVDFDQQVTYAQMLEIGLACYLKKGAVTRAWRAVLDLPYQHEKEPVPLWRLAKLTEREILRTPNAGPVALKVVNALLRSLGTEVGAASEWKPKPE